MTVPDDVVTHDQGVPPGPRIRVRVLIALLRVAAGRRGHAHIRWWGQGFRYDVTVERRTPVAYQLDADPDALGLAEVRTALDDRIAGDA